MTKGERVRESLRDILRPSAHALTLKAVSHGQRFSVTEDKTLITLIAQILDAFKQAGYVRLDPDQSLPKSSIQYSNSFEDQLLRGQRNIARNEMLEANFRKVELKE